MIKKALKKTLILLAGCCILLVFILVSFRTFKPQEDANDLTIESVDPLVKVTPDFSPQSLSKTTTYYYARNEEVHIQLVVWNKPGVQDFLINANLPPRFFAIASVQKVGYVSIKQQCNNINNKVESSSNRFPDPLLDVAGKLNLTPNAVTSFWINFKIPVATPAGNYPVTINCTATLNYKLVSIVKHVNIIVSRAIVNKQNYPWMANWVIVDMPTMGPTTKKLKFINNNVDITPFDNNYWKKISDLSSFLASTGQNVIMMSPQRLAKYSYNGNNLQIDFSRFDSMLTCYTKAGVVKRLEGWQVCSRPGGFESNYVIYYIKKDSIGRAVFASGQPEDAAVQAYYKVYLPALIQHLKSKKIYNAYYQHIADEPIDANADSYIRIIKMIKSIAPDLKTLEPIQTMKVAQYLTIPIPQLDYLNKHSDFFENLVQQGKEVWFYTAFQPQGTYANRFIEQQALQHRMLFWILAKYNLKGALNWGFNYWDVPDPFKDLGAKSGQFTMPAGDGWLVYPKNDGLISSIRMETLKDGLNDYALLQALKKRNPALTQSLINQVVSNYKTYTTDIQLFRNVRAKMLQALN